MSQLIIACLLLSVAFLLSSCGGGPSQRIKDIEAQKPIPTPTPGEREISGVFNVTGADVNGNEAYNGVLTVAPQGDAYGFRWTLNRGTRIGNGVQIGNAAAASFAATGGGKGCGVVLYKIASDGTMEGKIVKWGEDKYGKIIAHRTEGNGFVGKYSVVGNTPDGTGYAGHMTIKKDGLGYDLEWVQDYEFTPTQTFVAFGTWQGSVAAASFGGYQCSFALYDIKSNGNMEGNWGGQKSVTFGTESAKRQ